VRVEGLAPGSAAQDLQPGDIITELNGKPVKDVATLNAAMSQLKPGTTALLKVRRGDVSRFAAIPIPS
jgi:serine protease Do